MFGTKYGRVEKELNEITQGLQGVMNFVNSSAMDDDLKKEIINKIHAQQRRLDKVAGLSQQIHDLIEKNL